MRKTPEEIADEYMAEARKAGFRPKAKDAEKASAGAGGKSWKDGIITAEELQTKQFKPVRIILPNLIPEGVTILAGKPKIGKSFLALDVCLAVADETRFVLGQLKPIHGDALYLALEDNQRRLKKRLSQITQGQKTWSRRLQLHTEWQRFDRGGLEDIEAWCKSVKEPRLIWIDTLAKIRPPAGRNEQAYVADYRAIEGLQKLAGEYPGLGIVLNHHLRKASSEDDAFDDVSGTLGLTGAADTIIVIKRHLKVFVRGRDIEEGEFAAEFNRNTCRWSLVGDADEVFRSEERQAILLALKEAARSMSVPEIMAATERRDRKATETLLYKMAKDGEVIRAQTRGRWRHPDVPPDDDPQKDAPSSPVRIVRKVGNKAQTIDARRENGSRNPNGNPNGAETVRIGVRISEPHEPLICKDNPVDYHDPNDPNGIEHSNPPDDGLDPPTTLRRCHHCGKPGAERWDLNGRAVFLHEGCSHAWADRQERTTHSDGNERNRPPYGARNEASKSCADG
jgi:AAA domain